jgi:osmotically inducible protein OsmC
MKFISPQNVFGIPILLPTLFYFRNQKCLNFIMQRIASAIWHGGLKNGMGTISTESGVLKQTLYSFGARFEGQLGTNPEELLAAAHAGCFSMALAAEMVTAGLNPESIRTAVALIMERLEGGWTVTQIHLDVTVKLPDEDRDKFEAAANAAKAGCPISRLLNTKITMDAKLENRGNSENGAHESGSIKLQLGKRMVPSSLQHRFESHV